MLNEHIRNCLALSRSVQTEGFTKSILSIRTVLDNIDLLRCVLMYLDISALTGFYVAAARRTPLEFCKAITVMHTGYYTPIPVIGPTNEEYFGELFNVRRAFAPSVIAQLRTIVLFVREIELLYCPLSYQASMLFLKNWCKFVEPVDTCCSRAEVVAINLTKNTSAALLAQVQLSKASHSVLCDQIICKKLRNLKYILLETPFTPGESALESLRTCCPLLERFDLLFTLSVKDFEIFINPDTIWPSLKVLEVGKLLTSFSTSLELEEYFNDDFDAVDIFEVVSSAMARILTTHKFPCMQELEIYADSDLLLSFFEALIRHWVLDRNRKEVAFIGCQLESVSIVAEEALTSVIDSHQTIMLAERWADLFRASNGNSHRHCRMSDPALRNFCIFPTLREVVFLPDLPSSNVMWLFNCGSTPPHPLSVRVQGQHGRCLAEFVQNALRTDIWLLYNIEFNPLRYCSIAVRRWIVSRRVSCVFVEANSLATATAEYQSNCYWPGDDAQLQDVTYDRMCAGRALCAALHEGKMTETRRLATPLTLAIHGLGAMDERDNWTECFAQLRVASLVLDTIDITAEVQKVIIRYLQRGAQRELPPLLERIELRVYTCRVWRHFLRESGQFWVEGGMDAIAALNNINVAVYVVYEQQSVMLAI
jgi:hypothetical protein